jgi:hypothetical protein
MAAVPYRVHVYAFARGVQGWRGREGVRDAAWPTVGWAGHD